MVHLGVITHNTLVGESNGETLVLDVVSLAGGDKLSLVTALANLNLTYVSGGTKANAVGRLVRKMHRKLVDDGVGIVRYELLFVGGA